jgi:hypothetical protein
MGLFLSTVSTDVTINDLKGYTFVHPTVNFVLYDLFTEEDIQESDDLQTEVAAGTVIITDENGRILSDLSTATYMLQATYDANNDGKVDADASQVESVNGQTGIVNITDPTFGGTTAIPGSGVGNVPDDGVLGVGSRALFDDGSWKEIETETERFEAYNTVTTTGFSTSAATVLLDQTRINSAPSLFSFVNSELTVNSSINALISYRVSTEISSGSARSTSFAWIELDTGSGFAEVEGSRAFMYNRTLDSSANTGSSNILLNLNAGDKIRLRVQRQDGSDTLNTIIQGCNLSVIDLMGGRQGPQGPKGDDGTPGGPPGPQGENGYGVFAFSKTSSAGSILDARGFSSVTLVTTGTYDYVFSTASDNADYVVSASHFNELNDTNIFISNNTVNGFRVTIGDGDNGGTPDILKNVEHSVTVINASGGLQGISSAYESWLNIGNVGTEGDFINSLIGPPGTTNHSGLNLDDGTNPHGTTKADVGLSNVDNTSDLDKPVSTATEAAIKHDRSMIYLDTIVSTTSSTYVSLQGLEYTTKNLGGAGTYIINVSVSRRHSGNNIPTEIAIEVGGTIINEATTASFANETHIISLSAVVSGVTSGTLIRIQTKTASGTHTILNRAVTIDGILDSRVAT